ncbi:MAG: hypothetical protein KatS3mg054_0102 [Chloroflexus sp.]|nr:MAG: hypothetical protein KatS3mg054_0102 [Chloroflexus sp.]
MGNTTSKKSKAGISPTLIALMLEKFSDEDVLRAMIAGEAIGEPYLGKVAVAYVAVNRAKLASMRIAPWPKTIKEVILQPYQFSCFWSDWPKRKADCLLCLIDKDHNVSVSKAARDVLTGAISDPTGGADHYHAIDIPKPKWAHSMKKVAEIGRHVFYRSIP